MSVMVAAIALRVVLVCGPHCFLWSRFAESWALLSVQLHCDFVNSAEGAVTNGVISQTNLRVPCTIEVFRCRTVWRREHLSGSTRLGR